LINLLKTWASVNFQTRLIYFYTSMSFFSWLFGGDKASSTQATAPVEPDSTPIESEAPVELNSTPAAPAEPIQAPVVTEPMSEPTPAPVEPSSTPVEPPAQDNADQSNQVQGM
jgi:hypothetical protein